MRLHRLIEFHHTLIFFAFFDHGGGDGGVAVIVTVANGKLCPDANTFAANDDQPAGIVQLSQQQDLRCAAGGHFACRQPCRDHARLIKHHHVAGIQILW